MSPFAIFTIVLTLAYVIYYGVMISRDLTKNPGQEEAQEETIEVDTFAQAEEPETVKSVMVSRLEMAPSINPSHSPMSLV